MKRKIKIFIMMGLFTLLTVKGFSQMSVSYYASSLAKAGVGYHFGERLWGELRLYSNTYWDDITPELVVNYNYLNRETYNAYLGLGGVVNFFQGIVMPVGVQFMPVKMSWS